MIRGKEMFRYLTLLLMLPLAACSYSDEKPSYAGLTLCPEVRPQICTREYNPVCATLNDGGIKTYSTGCTSCADENVIGYKFGEC